jgi:NAD(P)-dependent dehydrogenase (short-subunit alcohol dehydrogenase family)
MGAYTGKKAVVSGGTHGMGLATVRALLQGGAEVLLTGKSEGNVEAARRELAGRAHVERSDATRSSDIAALAGLVTAKLGRVDFAFINAGYCKMQSFLETSEANYDQTFGVNAKGAFFTAQRLAPLMNEGGAFVFTTSIANEMGYPGMSVYAGAKAAVRAFVRGMAVELAPRKIRVNSLSPGFVKTPSMGLAEITDEERVAFEKEGVEMTPLGRIASGEEVARAALFLAFDATFTTGAELTIDGGLLQL